MWRFCPFLACSVNLRKNCRQKWSSCTIIDKRLNKTKVNLKFSLNSCCHELWTLINVYITVKLVSINCYAFEYTVYCMSVRPRVWVQLLSETVLFNGCKFSLCNPLTSCERQEATEKHVIHCTAKLQLSTFFSTAKLK